MSHNITEIDSIIVPAVNESYKTWHGLEKKSQGDHITLQDVEDAGIHPTIIESPVTAVINEQQVTLPNYKSLIAQTNMGELHPVHISKDKYSVIQNKEVWDSMETALTGIDHTISCVGTLGGLRKYFISVELGDNKFFEVNGDKFYGNLNFITSHDGSLAMQAYDSVLRLVCQNTLNWSLQASKNMEFKVHHKGNTGMIVNSLGKFINSILQGREHFKEVMEEFNSIDIYDNDIEDIVAGYFLLKDIDRNNTIENGFSTRTANQIHEVSRLARTGLGNKGETLYDVFNGATEFWTSGDGVGKTTSAGKRAYSSEFGTASANKTQFTDYLQTGKYKVWGEKGGKVLAMA